MVLLGLFARHIVFSDPAVNATALEPHRHLMAPRPVHTQSDTLDNNVDF